MPRDSNGNYSLASGYKATPGETILASQHNPPLEDLASAMTGSLPRDGSAPMGGPIKTTVGTASSPAIYPNGNPSVGIHFANGKVNFVGQVAGLRYIGELIPYTLLTPEPLTVLPYGQTLLRASCPDLWTKAQADIAAGNTFYNNGDGSTTFGIGDMRGRVPAGKDNMGGAAAGRLTTAGSGINGAVLGAVGGAETQTLTAAQLAAHTHSGSTGPMNANASHSHTGYLPGWGRRNLSLNDSTGLVLNNAGNEPVTINPANIDHGHPFTTNSGDGVTGAAHNNTQATLVCNYLLYVGA
jgi:microcystin-dependent protein